MGANTPATPATPVPTKTLLRLIGKFLGATFFHYIPRKWTYGVSMMIILHGDTIEQLTFILSEFRAALAVTNPGCGSRQPHTEQL